MGRYIERDHPEAEELFERLIGYPLAKSTYIELHGFNRRTGCQIQLKHEPIELLICEGHILSKEYFLDNWVQIPLRSICWLGRVLDIPPSLFGLPYQQVKVTYTAGIEEIPEDVRNAVKEISDLLCMDNINAWNLPLSQNTLLTIDRYKKRW